MSEILERRLELWNLYHSHFQSLEEDGLINRPYIPNECEHNGHIYYIVLKSEDQRDALIQKLNRNSIQGIFHYIPLHSSPAGKKYGKIKSDLPITDELSKRLLRLPLWVEMKEESVVKIVKLINSYLIGDKS